MSRKKPTGSSIRIEDAQETAANGHDEKVQKMPCCLNVKHYNGC